MASNYPNRFLEYNNAKGRFIDQARFLADQISSMFYPAPQNTDIAEYLYNKPNYGIVTNAINMSPDDYLKQSYNTYHYNMPTSSIVEPYDAFLKRLERETYDRGLVDKLQSGQKLDMPELRYDERGRGVAQEGNHRAMAAKIVGEKNIPVAITTYEGSKGMRDAFRKNISKALRFGGKVLMGVDPYFMVNDMLKLQGYNPRLYFGSSKERQNALQEYRERLY